MARFPTPGKYLVIPSQKSLILQQIQIWKTELAQNRPATSVDNKERVIHQTGKCKEFGRATECLILCFTSTD